MYKEIHLARNQSCSHLQCAGSIRMPCLDTQGSPPPPRSCACSRGTWAVMHANAAELHGQTYNCSANTHANLTLPCCPSQVMRMQLSDMGSPSALVERRMVEMLVASKGLDPLPPGEEWKVSPCLRAGGLEEA